MNLNDLSNLNINIPTLIISRKDGEKMIDLVKKKSQIKMKFNVPVNKSSSKVTLDYFFKLEDEKFYLLMR